MNTICLPKEGNVWLFGEKEVIFEFLLKCMRIYWMGNTGNFLGTLILLGIRLNQVPLIVHFYG